MQIMFASVDDLEAGWRTLSTSERSTAQTLIERASAYIMTLMTREGVEIDVADTLQVENIKSVTCGLVRRSMETPIIEGVASMSQGIGATNASVSFANPDGRFFLTKSDKQLLGIGGVRIGSIRPKIGGGGCPC